MNSLEIELQESFIKQEYKNIPGNLKDAMIRYVVHKILPGGFLKAVLENNLFLAVGKADDNSQKNLSVICKWFYNIPPSSCWGSPKIVNKYLTDKVLNENTDIVDQGKEW